MDGKTLLVLSDTHGNVSTLEAVLRWVKSLQDIMVGMAVFLGDGIRDLSRAVATTGYSCDWKIIRGNNDDGFSVPDTAVLDFCGNRFFLCHGHRYSLYSGYHILIAAARNVDANIALFGHTHVPCCENAGGIMLINPGSIGRPRSNTGATFALVDCEPEESLAVRLWGIGPKGEIREMVVP